MGLTTQPTPTLIGQQYPYSAANPLGIKNWTNYANFTNTTNNSNQFNGNGYTRVIYAGGYYVFGDSSGYLYYSTDAKTWSYAYPTAGNSGIYGVAYNGTNWCIVTSANTIYTATSPNGTWTSRTSVFQATNQINDIRWIPQISLFIATARTTATPWTGIASSPDGITWTARYQLPASASQYYTIGLDDTTGTPTIAVASNQATSVNVIYSTNGTTWAAVDATSGVGSYGIQFIKGLNRWVAGGGNEYAQTSAAIGTAWGTAPYTQFYTWAVSSRIQQSNQQIYGRDEWVYDSVNNLYYVMLFPYGSGSSNIFVNTQLFTYDASKTNITSFTTGTNTNYAMTLLKTENLPFNSYSTQIPSGNNPNYGYVNGIHIYSCVNTQDGARQIWTTA